MTYQSRIARRHPAVNPRHVEALMREATRTLDALSWREFDALADEAAREAAASDPAVLEALADVTGLRAR